MIKNLIFTALRNIKKYKTFSFINIFGLAISMSVCLLIIMLIKDAYKFDKFHPKSDLTYRILTDAIRKGGGIESYATTPFPLGIALKEDFPYVKNLVSLVTKTRGQYEFGDKTFSLDGLMTNNDFFNTFGFKLAKGDLNSSLSEPFQIILTQESAEKFFGESNPIGETLKHSTYGDFTVSGVLVEFPGKTHLEFEFLTSLSTLDAIENLPGQSIVQNNWNNYYNTYQYIQLNEGTEPKKVEEALTYLATEKYKDLALETRDESYRFRLQPLLNITPGPIISNNMGRGMPNFLLWFLMALGGIVILSACFNYTNLTVARSMVRAKEVGVRKIIGGKSTQIFTQFLGESVMVSILALAIALFLVKLTIPLFNQLQFLEFTDVSIVFDISTILWFLLFAILVGVVAGLLPSILFSRFQPLTLIHRMNQTAAFRKLGFRKILVVAQFTVSAVFLILLTIAWKQTDYAIEGNFGFLNQSMINLDLQGESYAQVSSKIGQVRGVESISAISHLMGTFEDSKVDVQLSEDNDKIGVRDYSIDHQYLENFGIDLIAGSGFTNQTSQKTEKFAIVNEKFVESFKMGTPMDAIGRTVIVEDSTKLSVIGVTEDFIYKPMNNELEPFLLRYNPSSWSYLNIQLNEADLTHPLTGIENSWIEINEHKLISFSFYRDTISENFANIVDIIWIIGYFGILGIIIACLGLLGMAIYASEARAKEISIRKVVGANSSQLVKLLSKGFIWLLVITCCLAIPISYLLGQQLLQTFAYRITIGITLFIPGIAILLVLGLVTIGSQTLKAVTANPIDNLQDE